MSFVNFLVCILFFVVCGMSDWGCKSGVVVKGGGIGKISSLEVVVMMMIVSTVTVLRTFRLWLVRCYSFTKLEF